MRPQLRVATGSRSRPFTFLEFFAGGGMARAGLGQRWRCQFANDFDLSKATVYKDNYGDENFCFGDVHKVSPDALGPRADLAWASFPCQDLSLAGNQGGLSASRSGAFWGFWKLMQQLAARNDHPNMIVLENVYGAVTANQGRDFSTLLSTLRSGGYRVGALVIDAIHFVPQSRPRLFVIAVRRELHLPTKLSLDDPLRFWTPEGLSSVLRNIADPLGKDWISWRLPAPAARAQRLSDLIDEDPTGVDWHSAEETNALLEMMSDANRNKVRQAQLAGRRIVGALYKRTRPDKNGVRRQRAEVRFDEVAGCLRTPSGGSSRQTILVVNGSRVRSRLLSPREAARLMGLSEEYRLPKKYNDAYHLAGDGVVVPVVRHLAEYIIEPTLAAQRKAALQQSA